jgi:hypothetical protein
MMDALTSGERHRVSVLPAVLLSSGLTLLVLVVLLPNLWYGLHDISDIPVYQGYAERIAIGEAPFTGDFRIEYPPLAVPLFRLPGHVGSLGAYTTWFSVWMGVLTTLTAALTAFVACRLWPVGGRAYTAAVLFPVGVALTGAIIVNRYDVAVALVVAALLACLVQRWYIVAALVLGAGFALKITPAAILPLVLILAGPPKRWLWPIVAFSLAALAPFVQYLVAAPGGIWYVFHYHMARPLQIESVLGTPMLLGQLLGANWARYGSSYGSHSLVAPGAHFAATASGGLTLLAVVGVYVLVWRRRERLLHAPQEQVLAVLTLILALMTFSKVLSPQYVIWLLPAWALVGAGDRVLGILGGLVLLLTQVEFPVLYWRLLSMDPSTLAIVIARNTLLVAFFAVAMWRLWRLPGDEAPRAAAHTSRAVQPPS